MKKSSRGRREQPHWNMETTADEEQTYSLEEILDEFGGWSKRGDGDAAEENTGAAPPDGDLEPPPDKTEAETAEEPEQASAPAASAAPAASDGPAEPEARPRRFQFIRLETASMEQMLEEPAEASPEMPEPPAADRRVWTYRPAAEAAPVRPVPPGEARRASGAVRPPRRRNGAQKRPARETPRRTAEKPVFPPADEAYRSLCRQTRSLMMRRRIALLLCALAAAVTACCHLEVAFGAFLLEERLASQILMGLLLAGALTAYDVLVGGVYQALRLRPNLDTLLAVSAVVFAVDGFLHMGENARMPNTAVLLLGLFFALWGRVLANRAKRRSLKAALSMEEHPMAAVMSRRAWGSRDCVFRSVGDREQYVADLEAPSGADQVMGVYAPVVLCLSLVLAVLMQALRQQDALACWSVMLAGSIPAAAFITYWRPFASLAGRLLHAGAALCGWRGARALSGPCCIAVEDRDLFSRANVAMNGMKVFGEYNVSQVVGYTYAVVAESGCGLEPVFHDVFVNQNGRSYVIDNFRRYEGGGIGAEIQGEVILVGSIGFMQLMGVRMPEGTNVRQAVYCAVNHELAAVFALNYNPAPAVRSGLQTVLRSKGLTLLLATRDFILTPAMVRHKYKIPSDCMEYPPVEERVRLSGPRAAAGGFQAALLARDGFLSLAEAVAGGRSLCGSVWAGLCVNLLGGVLGFGITAVLAWLGAFAAASAFNLMLFVLLWTLPALLLTSIAGK